jgi:hypothetical protein
MILIMYYKYLYFFYIFSQSLKCLPSQEVKMTSILGRREYLSYILRSSSYLFIFNSKGIFINKKNTKSRATRLMMMCPLHTYATHGSFNNGLPLDRRIMTTFVPKIFTRSFSVPNYSWSIEYYHCRYIYSTTMSSFNIIISCINAHLYTQSSRKHQRY